MLLSSFVLADDLTTNLLGYWKIDGTTGVVSDSLSINDGTIIGSPSRGETGIINNAILFDSTSNEGFRKTTPTGLATFGTAAPTGTINLWVYPTTQPAGIYGLVGISDGSTGTTNGHQRIFSLRGSTGKLFYSTGHSYPGNYVDTTVLYTEDAWNMFTFVYDTSQIVKIYKNSVYHSNYNLGATFTPSYLFFGYGTDIAIYAATPDVKEDEIGIWSKALNQTEIDELYNSGTGISYPFSTSATEFKLNLTNDYNETYIDSFSATITNSTGSFTISTTNGSIYTPIYEDLIDIFIWNINSNTYFNQTYNDYNNSIILTATSYQAQVNMILTNLANTTEYTDVDWFLNNTDENINTSNFINDGITTKTEFNLTSGQYKYLAEKIGYPNTNGTFTLSPLDNITIYAEAGFFATLNLIDEETLDPFNLSSANSTEVIVVCADIGSYKYTIDNSTYNLSISCEYTKLRFTMTYDNTVYTRVLLSSETDIFTQDVYLINLLTTQSIFNSFIINDYAGQYLDIELFIMKNIEGAQVVIHSDQIDAENKMSTYLIENDEYILVLKSSNNPDNVLGFYGADLTGSKEITVTTSNVDTSVDSIIGTGITAITYITGNSSTLQANAFYTDENSNTTSVKWDLLLFNTTNESLQEFYTATISGSSSIVFTPQNVSEYENYTLYGKLTYIIGGDTTVLTRVIYTPQESVYTNSLFEGYDFENIQWGVVLFLSVIMLLGTVTTQIYVNYLILGLAGIFAGFQLMTISIVILVLGLLFNFLYHMKVSDNKRLPQ